MGIEPTTSSFFGILQPQQTLLLKSCGVFPPHFLLLSWRKQGNPPAERHGGFPYETGALPLSYGGTADLLLIGAFKNDGIMGRGRRIFGLYRLLLAKYGRQGWWPIGGKYHPGDYGFPKSERQRLEICLGAILAQNISWNGAERAVANLRRLGAIGAKRLLALPDAKLKRAIKPAGYFNQKARKLREFAKFYLGLKGAAPSRTELLPLWGIGKETADSILLYAYRKPIFVVDAYTRRIFLEEGLISGRESYDDIRELVESSLPQDARIFNEFHALIVRHAKEMKRKAMASKRGQKI